MKKFLFCLLMLGCFFVGVLACNFNRPWPKPENGTFYCKELNISINFSQYMSGNHDCVTIYYADGSSIVATCNFDFGSGMYFHHLPPNDDRCIFVSSIRYREWLNEDLLLVTRNEDDAQFEFVRVDESELPNITSIP